MSRLGSWWKRGRLQGVALAGLLGTCLTLGHVLQAAAPVIQAKDQWPAESLTLVPADAAFYNTFLRVGDRIETIAKSNAWAKFKNLPLVQMAWRRIEAEFSEEGFLAAVYTWYQQPENKQLVALLGDMFSHEIFIYGGASWPEFTGVFQDVYAQFQYGPMLARLNPKGEQRSELELQIRALLKGLARHEKALRIPDMVIGFRLSKANRAQAQLKRLKDLIDALAGSEEKLKGRYQEEKINGGTYLTLKLDGSLFPWDDLPIKDLEDKEGEFAPLVKRLKQLKLTIAIGVRDNHLLVSLGETTAPLARLAKGKLLVERKEFAPLGKFGGKKFNAISFFSQAMMEAASGDEVLGTYGSLARQALDHLPLEEKQKARIHQDLKALGQDLKKYMPKAGPVLSFSFATPHGQESYQYDAGQYTGRDGSKPLTLMNHAGGSPLPVTVSRTKSSPEQYKTLVKWVGVGFRYFEEYGVPNLPDKETYEKFSKALVPLVKRLSETTEKSLLPALADGQAGFVLDAKLTSKQWFRAMPEADQPLPLPEPALIFGVSDAAQLRKAFNEYRATVNTILAKVHDLAPDNVPVMKLPPPKAEKNADGTLYYYPLPETLGVDPQISPNGGLSENVGVLSVPRKHSQRLLASTPLKAKGGPLAKLDRNLSDATYVHWEGIIQLVTPWVVYAYQKNVPDETDQLLGGLLGQIRTILEVLQVFKTYSSVTYLENGIWVTHSEVVIRDLPRENGK